MTSFIKGSAYILIIGCAKTSCITYNYADRLSRKLTDRLSRKLSLLNSNTLRPEQKMKVSSSGLIPSNPLV